MSAHLCRCIIARIVIHMPCLERSRPAAGPGHVLCAPQHQHAVRRAGAMHAAFFLLMVTMRDRHARKALVAPIELAAGGVGEMLIFAHGDDIMRMRAALPSASNFLCVLL